MAFNTVITKWNTRTKANGTQMSLSLQQCEDNDNYLLGLTTSLATDIYDGDQILQEEIDDLTDEVAALSIDDQFSVFTSTSSGTYSFKIATALKTRVPTTYNTVLNYEIINNYMGRISGAWGMRNHAVYRDVFQIDDQYTTLPIHKTLLYEFDDRWELWGETNASFTGAIVIRPANNLSVSTSLYKNVWVFPGKVYSATAPTAYSIENPTGYTGWNSVDYTDASFDDRRTSTWAAEASADDHLVLRSSDDAVPGYLADKLVTDTSLDFSDITEDGVKKILMVLANPLHYVKGTTEYGGTLLPATTGDCDTLTHNGFWTAYYNSVHTPPAQTGNPSWFVLHMNSNTGIVSAIQIAYAYINTSIICYERVKLASTWGSWILRSSGTSGSSVSMMDTMTIGSAFSSCALNPGSDTQWAGHGTRIQPYGSLTALATSVMKISMPQVVSGKSLIFGLYSYNESTHLQTKKAATGIITMPSASSDIVGPLTDLIDGSFNTNDIYYAVVFTNANGCSVRGVMSSQMNFQPYASGLINNLGVLTAAPSSFTFEGESANNLFVRVKV